MGVQAFHTCECGQSSGWISVGETTPPCGNCGRQYTFKFNPKTYLTEVMEVKQRGGIFRFFKALFKGV